MFCQLYRCYWIVILLSIGDAQPPEYENVTNLDVNNSPQPEVQNTGTENSDNGHLCSLVQGKCVMYYFSNNSWR